MSHTSHAIPSRFTPAAVLLAALVGSACGGGGESEREAAALTGAIGRLTAFEAALGGAPANASGFAAPDGAALIACGADCDAGANTMFVTPGETLAHYRELLQATEDGQEPFNLVWFREHTLPHLPNLRFFATKLPDDTTSATAWHGRVAVWDTHAGAWIGAVRVDLDRGRVPQSAYAYFDAQGNQVGGPFHDAEQDAARATRRFDAMLPRAFEAAIESGRDVSRLDQVTRRPRHPLGPELAADAVVFTGGDNGDLAALSGGAFVDLGVDEVTDVDTTRAGFAYRRARNRLDEGTPWMLRVSDGQVDDLTFFSDRTLMGPVTHEHDDRPWVTAHDTRGTAELARWVEGDWEVFDLAEVQPSARSIVAVDELEGTVVVLATGADGAGLHVRTDSGWASLPLEGRGEDVLLESPSSALVATGDGLLRVDLRMRENVSLTRHAALGLFRSPQGPWLAQRVRARGPITFARVDGASVRQAGGLHADALDRYVVGPEGTLAVESRGIVHVLRSDGAQHLIPAEGAIPGRVRAMEIDGHGTIWIGSTSGVFVGTDEGLHTLAAAPVDAVARDVRDLCVLGSGPALSAEALRPVP